MKFSSRQCERAVCLFCDTRLQGAFFSPGQMSWRRKRFRVELKRLQMCEVWLHPERFIFPSRHQRGGRVPPLVISLRSARWKTLSSARRAERGFVFSGFGFSPLHLAENLLTRVWMERASYALQMLFNGLHIRESVRSSFHFSRGCSFRGPLCS